MNLIILNLYLINDIKNNNEYDFIIKNIFYKYVIKLF